MALVPLNALTCVVLLCSQAFSFVIQKRSINANRLADALDVLQRERRRIQNDGPNYDLYDYDQGLDDTLLKRILASEQNDEDIIPQYDLPTKWDSTVGPDGYFEKLFQNDGGSSKIETISDQDTQNELENIFESDKTSDDSSNADDDDKQKVVGKEEKIIEEKEKHDESGDTEKIKEVLKEVKDTSKEHNEELKQIFDGDDDVNESETQEKLSDSQENEDNIVNKEWLADYLPPDQAESSTIAKRSQAGGISEESDLTMEDLKALVMAMTLKSELEDKENTHLANALNLATKSQLENTDQYLDEEFKELSNAIETEQTLQVLETGQMPETLPSQPSSEVSNEIKRDGSLPGDARSDDKTSDDFALSDEELSKLIKMYKSMPEYVEQGEWGEEPLDDGYTGEVDNGEYRLNPFLRRLVKLYWQDDFGGDTPKPKRADEYPPKESSTEAREKAELESIIDNYIENQMGTQLYGSGQCPAVDHVVNNCKMISDLGVGMDAEALDMCNRHEMCYACGASFDKSRLDCDEGYLQGADGICKTEECRDDAVNLYMLMKDLHQYNSQGVAICQQQCVVDYILGLD